MLHYQKTCIYIGANFVQRHAYITDGIKLTDKGCLVVAAFSESLRKCFPLFETKFHKNTLLVRITYSLGLKKFADQARHRNGHSTMSKQNRTIRLWNSPKGN